jgi:hypothetical protein
MKSERVKIIKISMIKRVESKRKRGENEYKSRMMSEEIVWL